MKKLILIGLLPLASIAVSCSSPLPLSPESSTNADSAQLLTNGYQSVKQFYNNNIKPKLDAEDSYIAAYIQNIDSRLATLPGNTIEERAGALDNFHHHEIKMMEQNHKQLRESFINYTGSIADRLVKVATERDDFEKAKIACIAVMQGLDDALYAREQQLKGAMNQETSRFTQNPPVVSTQNVQPSVNNEDDEKIKFYLRWYDYSATPKEIQEVRDYMKSHGLTDPWKMGPLMDDDDKLTGYLKAHGNIEVTQTMIDQLRGYMSAHGLRHIAELPK